MEKEGLIEILPEGVANQIAAGEVVQRPASAVKELLENAVDAEATSIELNIEDSGRTLIQVKDNGIGMSGRDLELAFERHATSKIKEAKDLFSLLTMGFRGEALASIAAVAQLTSHTKRAQDEIGWSIQIDGGKKKKSEQVATQNGTLINVRNLFFNIPARRNFLKSDAVEFRHISDEFHRVALSRPDISFRLIHNGTATYNLPAANFRRRIVSLMGTAFDQRLVPVKEETPLLNIEGFVGKPEFARKTRGEQFLFVNNRYVRSHSLHYSILQAFEGLIGEGRHPAYFLKLDIDPKHIDINIHPTKTEIKFDDERSVFGLLKASVKHALGQFNVAPTIDFNVENSFKVPFDPNRPVRPPVVKVNPDFNPFNTDSSGKQAGKSALQRKEWSSSTGSSYRQEELLNKNSDFNQNEQAKEEAIPWTERFVLRIEDEMLRVIDIQRAHERVLYDDNIKRLNSEQSVSQQLLFPKELEMKPEETIILRKLSPQLLQMGFDIEIESDHKIKVNGLPFGMLESGTTDALDTLLEWEMHSAEIKNDQRIRNVAAAFAKAQAIENTRSVSQEEINYIIGSLSRQNWPDSSWDGSPIWWEILPSAMQD
jgi:DNA mismatch repair protein MutL